MIMQRRMKQYNKISDEELAAYLEGMLSCEDTARIDSAMDIDTLEVLGVAGKRLMNSRPTMWYPFLLGIIFRWHLYILFILRWLWPVS